MRRQGCRFTNDTPLPLLSFRLQCFSPFHLFDVHHLRAKASMCRLVVVVAWPHSTGSLGIRHRHAKVALRGGDRRSDIRTVHDVRAGLRGRLLEPHPRRRKKSRGGASPCCGSQRRGGSTLLLFRLPDNTKPVKWGGDLPPGRHRGGGCAAGKGATQRTEMASDRRVVPEASVVVNWWR